MNFDLNKPDAVNEKGIKFWFDLDSTAYAQQPNQQGVVLDGWRVFLTEMPNGQRAYLLVNENNQPVDESTSLDGIGIKIDLLKFLRTAK